VQLGDGAVEDAPAHCHHRRIGAAEGWNIQTTHPLRPAVWNSGWRACTASYVRTFTKAGCAATIRIGAHTGISSALVDI